MNSDSDGFADQASTYKLFNAGSAIDLTIKRGKSFSDASTPNWDAIKAVKTTSGFRPS